MSTREWEIRHYDPFFEREFVDRLVRDERDIISTVDEVRSYDHHKDFTINVYERTVGEWEVVEIYHSDKA